jgi:hypothetical protein
MLLFVMFIWQVNSIQKELTIVGISAFIFKIVVIEFLVLPGNWLHSLEYSDLLIPIFSLSYCSIGIGLIMMSIQQCSIWRRAHHLHIFELLDNHFQAGKGIKMPSTWDIIFNKSEIEFRIFRDIFYEMNNIQKKALAFDVYTENMFERFVSFIIEIRPFDRFLLCCILLINMGRMELNLFTSDCSSSSGDGHSYDGHSYNDAYIQCKDNSLIVLFTIVGAVLFIVTCLITYISRRIEIAILHRSGITSCSQYAYFLQNMESNQMDSEGNITVNSVEIRRLSKDDLKFAAIEALQAAKRKKLSGRYNVAHKLFPSYFKGDVAELNIFDKLSSSRSSYSFRAVSSGADSHLSQYVAALSSAQLPILGEYDENKSDVDEEPVENFVPEGRNNEPRVVPTATQDSQKTSVRSFDEDDNVDDDTSGAVTAMKPSRVSTYPDNAQPSAGEKSQQQQQQTKSDAVNVANLFSRSKINCMDKGDQPYIPLKSHSPVSRGAVIHPTVLSSSTLNTTSKSHSSDSSSRTRSGIVASPPLIPDAVSHSDSDRIAPHLLSPKQHLNAAKNITQPSHVESGADYARRLQSRRSHFARLFPFSSPEFFFEVIHCLIMFNSFYIALYLTSFLASTADVKWKVVSMLPGLGGVAVFICLVRSAALIHVIFKVNFEAILEVQEQTESTEQLQVLVRQTILMKLMVMADMNLGLTTSRTKRPSFSWINADIEIKLQAQLQSLFNEIDTSGDGKLSQLEFVSFMKALNINMSKKKWNQVRTSLSKNLFVLQPFPARCDNYLFLFFCFLPWLL